jgi:hypothetical protein
VKKVSRFAVVGLALLCMISFSSVSQADRVREKVEIMRNEVCKFVEFARYSFIRALGVWSRTKDREAANVDFENGEAYLECALGLYDGMSEIRKSNGLPVISKEVYFHDVQALYREGVQIKQKVQGDFEPLVKIPEV